MAVDNNNLPIRLEHLCGDGEWVSALKQAQEIPWLPSETFVTFVEQLTRAIELQVKKEGAQEQVLEEMALTDANEQCKATILSLPMEPAPTLDDMLQKSPEVIVKDPVTRETKSPHDLVTWGHVYAYVSTPPGLKSCDRTHLRVSYLVGEGEERVCSGIVPLQVVLRTAEIVDCTCRTRLKGIRCDTPLVKYQNWDSYVKRQQSRPRGPPEEYPCCREDGTPPWLEATESTGKAEGNHPEWQRDCGMRSPSDPLVLALEKDNKATKEKPKRCCSTCSINQRCTHPDKVYQAEALEQETEDILKPAPRRRKERRRVVGDANSEPSLTPTPLTSSLASSSFGRTATEVGVSPPTPKPRDPSLPSSDSEWDEPEPLSPRPKVPSRGPIASRTRKQTRVVVQAPLRQAITSDGETKLIKVPFSSIDLEIWERIAKGYRSDPIGIAKKIKFIVKQHSPDWADLQLLLDALTETEKQLVLKVAGDLAKDDCGTTQEDVKDVFPLQDPG
ncbi:hypothetical protein DUI87_02637 [Hirundo rustica rustica]|uniref:Retroviral nucleocapsid Gag protein p24 C-terminal domain-containing protein n=1 Tax=Hirundo rustica rustica TaxID=333673 RepID=A0A3M0L8P1_HIRRU|nr:hypothetical protein DUI87_02637 [Hirundo rustica rustica]